MSAAFFQKLKTPVGDLFIVEEDKKICAVIFGRNWPQFKKRFPELTQKDSVLLKRTKKQLSEYFEGKRKSFNIPYNLNGTAFQKKVWGALQKISYGQTASYKQQAALVKSPLAVRAIGRADGLNPICIILPCHRVIGSDGSLTGYAGGMPAKRFLLKLEGSLKNS